VMMFLNTAAMDGNDMRCECCLKECSSLVGLKRDYILPKIHRVCESCIDRAAKYTLASGFVGKEYPAQLSQVFMAKIRSKALKRKARKTRIKNFIRYIFN
jgi:hypothetical protein